MTVPVCRCHGEPMRWTKDNRPRYKQGGYWRCAVKHKERQREYDRTEAGRARGRRYNNSPSGRERDKRYRNSPSGALNKQLLEMTRFRVRYPGGP